jgi:hypothetical protein
MAFNFEPKFSSAARRTLNKRIRLVESRDPKWVHQKYAYIILESMVGKSGKKVNDNDSIFSVLSKGHFRGVNAIGSNYGNNVTDLYTAEIQAPFAGVRRNQPYITSAKITSNYGSDIYDASILTADVSFQVSTKDDFEKVNTDFFSIGSKMKISYGWTQHDLYIEKGDDKSVRATRVFYIVNFSFTMGKDGTFNCNIRGMTDNGFIGQQSIQRTTNIDSVANVYGEFGAASPTLPSALKALAVSAFSIQSVNTNQQGQTAKIKELTIVGDLVSAEDPLAGSSNIPQFTWYASLLKHGRGVQGYNQFGEESKVVGGEEEIFYYIRFEDLITFIQSLYDGNNVSNHTFFFSTTSDETKIEPNIIQLGSADPRRYILPGNLAKYTPPSSTTNTSIPAGLSVQQAVQLTSTDKSIGEVYGPNSTIDVNIQNMLICLNVVEQFYDRVVGGRLNEKPTPGTTIEFIRLLSADIFHLTGGLVDVQVVPNGTKNDNTSFDNRFMIFNNNEVQKIVPNNPASPKPYTFNPMGENNITRDVSLESDFDAETALIHSVGRVKSGDTKIRPLTGLYPELNTELGDLTIDDNTKKEIYNLTTKFTITKLGIDSSTANSIANAMRKLLLLAEDIEIKSNIKELQTKQVLNKQSTFVSLPFYLKLSVTLDGIDDIGILQPITITRLPNVYKKAGASFVIQGIEHDFDGQGGWTTTLTAPMRLGNAKSPVTSTKNNKTTVTLSTTTTPKPKPKPKSPVKPTLQQQINKINRFGMNSGMK